jgi:type IV pilus assembly protein PilF
MKLFSKLVILLVTILLVGGCTTETVNDTSNSKNYEQAASINVQLGLQYLAQGSVSRAKQKLLLAVEQNPSLQSYGALAYFYEKTGESNVAGEYYLKAIAEEPSAGAGHNNYGAFLCRQGQYQQAEQQFELAVNDPNYLNDAGAYENAGLCALLVPNQQQAISYFQRALRQDPKRSTAAAHLVKIYYEQGQYQQANKYMQQYIKTNKLTADNLWLGVKIAQQLQQNNLVKEYGFLLKTQFPTSQEYQQFLQLKR